MRSATLRWIGLALLGIVVAAGVAVAASSLVSHQIGLASEPLSAGDALAPVVHQAAHPARGGQQTANRPTPIEPSTSPPPTEPTTTQPESVPPEPEPTPTPPSGSHDGGGDSGGEGGGGGADD